MNAKSIRFRLTIWYTSIFAVAMAVLFFAFYSVTRQSLLSHTDQAITAHSQRIVESISQEKSTSMDTTFISTSQSFAHQFTEMPGMVLIIGDGYGTVLYESQSLGVNGNIARDLLERSANIIRPTFVNRQIGTSTVRFGVFPAMQGSSKALVLMGQPMDVIQGSLNTLAFTLTAVYIVVFVLSFFGGFVLAGKAMNPVRLMSHKLQKISAEHLDERIPNPKTGDELEELSETFNGLLDNLHSSFARERQFIGDVAHELKTPLATLKSSIEVTLTKARTNEDYKKAFSDTLIDVNRLSETVKNILDLAWIGAENANTMNKDINVTAIMNDILEIAQKLAEQKKVRLFVNIASNVVVSGAENRLFRAILNIVDNAIKYTPSGKSVSLTLKKNKHRMFLTVKDTGIGMSQQDQDHIFERFYRGTMTKKTAGSGLGLAIAQGIIHAHNGDIRVISKTDKGTTVTVVLPISLHVSS